ncbi:MAG: single-stranded DNA-binding protein [Chlamydiales bacterium]
MNLVEIAGFLGADAEERFTSTGKRVISLRLATRTRASGKDDTIWWRVNLWGDRYDKMLPYLKKGTALIIVGELAKPEAYIGKDGNPAVSLTLNAEIIKFSPFGKSEKSSEQHSSSSGFAHAQSAKEELVTYGAPDSDDAPFVGDDLPF